MIKIRRIKSNIDVKGQINRYGFDYVLSDGLNIICGDNSSGKTTILSCIYYCLGMEQLLGGNKDKILDKSLRTSFSINSINYTVVYSEAILEIENDDGKKATIKRVIKGRSTENSNSLLVKETYDSQKSTKTYFIHSVGDHENESGFYSWLKQFSGIELPQIYQDDGSKVKSLYLQNIMSCALIEQTKGWSDLFSQMPYFGIKDSKTKVVEFLLGLKSLENDIKKDIFEQEKKDLKKDWASYLENFNQYMSRYSIQIDGLTEKYDSRITANTINRAKLYFIDSDNAILVDKLIKDIKKQLLDLSINVNSENNSLDKTNKQSDIIKSVRVLNKQLRELENKKITEKYKVEDYKKLVEKNKYNIDQVSGIKKIKKINDLKIINQCPTCNSELTHESRLELKEDKIDFDKSIAFLKSQQDLYQSYIRSSAALFEKLDSAILYYRKELNDKELQLNIIKKDISDINDLSREKIYQEIKLNKDILDYEAVNRELVTLKSKLKDIFDEINDINDKLESLKLNKLEDAQQILGFSNIFKRYLEQFEYSSNAISSVVIKDDYPAKLMPFIEIFRFDQPNEVQPIRLNSSASDFIRAEWAYYFALLISSNKHPGFLVFDEPGQHAMKTSSMQKLVSASEVCKKQIILTISKSLDKKNKGDSSEKNKVNNIEIITENNNCENINIIDIDPENKFKCIQALK
ncbi:AAA family ATPase [Photobacterium kishitanii]|uniref:AAA family ATPase n=1 Tax=Photobacterium kishitanii TaxID=318456 RepID=UPI000D1782DE|nr:AAA family ATPase [Photobacterium kishitanii]PSU23837.1 hypothetical protein CTM84_02715 [Photobacterium kishitanii]